MTPRGRRLRVAWLAGAVVAGLLTMHGLAMSGPPFSEAKDMRAAPVSAHGPGHPPNPPVAPQSPELAGSDTCMSTPAPDAAQVLPPAPAGVAAVAPLPKLSRAGRTQPARAGRAPPDLDELCISRT